MGLDSDVSFKIRDHMLRRRDTDTDPYGSRLLQVLALPAWLVRTVIWRLHERVLWPLADLFRGLGEVLLWPFQRLAWSIERRLIWPARERIAFWGYPRRAAGAGALIMVAGVAAALGVALAAEEDAEQRPAPAVRVALAEPKPATAEKPDGPTLQGIPPVFGVEEGVEVASAEGGTTGSSSSTSEEGGVGSEADAGQGEDGGVEGAAASSQEPVPAGPAAMKVARRFAEAFVFYEIGERPARVATVFQETATPRLASALADRPPRLPEDVKVPQARVLNLVPGPRQAKAYTVSVALLRVGSLSELRLKMKKQNGAWVVTDVRG